MSAKEFFAQAGIPVVPDVVAHSAAEAVRAQRELAGPVVLKVVSPDIAHKTEAGGVVLGVASAAAAEAAYTQILAAVRDYAPAARVDGVLVAPMIEDGVETLLGVANDPTFGPVLVFGLGGIFVEVLKDVTYRLAPFNVETARDMIGQIRGAALLRGVRGAEPADTEALAAALVRLSEIAAAHRASLDSIDINPFIVRPVGRGGVAADALLALKPVRDEGGA